MLELYNFVHGEKVGTVSGRTVPVVDPSTGEAYAEAPVSGPEDVESALGSAKAAFGSWKRSTPSERSLALLRVADAIEARAEELVRAEGKNTGKPFALTMSEEIPSHRRPDPLLRRCGAPFGRPGGHRVHGRAHVVPPA